MQPIDLQPFEAFVESNRQDYLDWFIDYLRVPTLAGRGIGVEEGAEATATMLRLAGAETEFWRVPGAPPVLYGEIGDGPVTLLIYDHYDVQPEEPLALWESPPFEPTIRDGKLFARGASDNRGEIAARVAAIHAYRKSIGPLPLKVKFIIEGEEEVGSPNLSRYVQRYADRLTADGLLWEGGGWDEQGRLSFALGGKGLLYVELHAQGPGYDLHSANAAIVESPIWRLLQALGTMRNERGQVTVDGWADAVRAVTAEDEALLREIPLEPEKLRASLQADRLLEEHGPALKRRLVFGPTCNVCGIEAGYTGQGPKTVLPSRAWCKLDFRLVPDLTPKSALEMLRRHLAARGFDDIEVRLLSGMAPSRSPADSRLARASVAAAETALGERPYLVPMFAGSGPFPCFADGLGLPIVSAGSVGYDGSRAHAPNENVRLGDWYGGIRFIGHLLRAFAEQP